MKRHRVSGRQARAGALAVVLWAAAAAGAGGMGLFDGSRLVFEPLSAIKPASRGRGPSFLSIVVGETGKEAVERALGPPSRVDKARGVVLWRGTAQCQRYDLGAIAVSYGQGKVVAWMELVLQHPEKIAAVERALHLGRPAAKRQEGKWTVRWAR